MAEVQWASPLYGSLMRCGFFQKGELSKDRQEAKEKHSLSKDFQDILGMFHILLKFFPSITLQTQGIKEFITLLDSIKQQR